MEYRFTWDAGKAQANRTNHGVSFEEASSVFWDPLAKVHDDPEHSVDERREVLVGRSKRGRLLMVSFTERGGVIRLISSRRVTRYERKDFEESL